MGWEKEEAGWEKEEAGSKVLVCGCWQAEDMMASQKGNNSKASQVFKCKSRVATVSVSVVDLPRRQDHHHVLRLRQIQLQTSPTLILHHLEPIRVLRNVAVEQIVVDVQQIVHELSVVLVSFALDLLTRFQARVAVTSVTDKAVHCYFVDFAQLNRLIVDFDGFVQDPFSWFLRGVPSEANTREGHVPPCEVGVHRDRNLQRLNQNLCRHKLHRNLIRNDIFDNSKGDWASLDVGIHPEVACVHHGDVGLGGVAVDGDEELEIGALLFADSVEAQIEVLFGETGDLLLLDLELFVDLFDVEVEFGVGLNLLLGVVDLFELDFEDPVVVLQPGGIRRQLSGWDDVRGIAGESEYGEVSEVGAALDEYRFTYFLVDDEVVVPPKYEVDALHLLGQLDVVVLHHVGQRDDQIALLLIAQLAHHLPCEFDEGDVLADFLVAWVECVNPFLLCQTEHAYLHSVLLYDEALESLGQSPLRAFVIDVAEQPRKAATFCHVHNMLQFVVEVVVAVAGQVDAQGLKGFEHVLALELIGKEGGGESIP